MFKGRPVRADRAQRYPRDHADIGGGGHGTEGNRDRFQGACPGRGRARRATGGAHRPGCGCGIEPGHQRVPRWLVCTTWLSKQWHAWRADDVATSIQPRRGRCRRPSAAGLAAGYAQNFWIGALAEVVRLTCQLTDVDIYLEADSNELDDLADLSGLGPRVGYFTVVASQPAGSVSMRPPGEVLKLEFSRSGCVITATEPDLETSGVIEAIRAFLAGRRRMPAWAYPLFREHPLARYLSPGH